MSNDRMTVQNRRGLAGLGLDAVKNLREQYVNETRRKVAKGDV